MKAEEFIKMLDEFQRLGLAKFDYSKFLIQTNRKGYVIDYLIVE